MKKLNFYLWNKYIYNKNANRSFFLNGISLSDSKIHLEEKGMRTVTEVFKKIKWRAAGPTSKHIIMVIRQKL